MSVSTTTSRVGYNGDGIVTTFVIPFAFFDDTDIKVILTAADGTETILTYGALHDYTLTGAGSPSGGSLVMNVAPANGEKITIYRDPDLTQDLDLVENDSLPAEELERRLDKLTMIAQRLSERLDRTIRLSEGYVGTFEPVMTSVPAAGTALVVNEAGTAFEEGPTATDIANAESNAVTATGAATSASASATAAASSASAAATSATNAGNSATAAAASATSASTSAATATTQASNASASATTATTQATTATTQATNAASSATAAATSATNAANSATAAASSQTAAATSATNAASSATAAASSQTAAATSATNAASSASAAAASAASFVAPNSRCVLQGGNGYGSSSTKIRRFLVPAAENIGTAFTVNDTATGGTRVTINEDGMYYIRYIDGNGTMAITDNNAPGNIAPTTFDTAHTFGYFVGGGTYNILTVMRRFTAGTILMAHTDGTPALGNAELYLTKISA